MAYQWNPPPIVGPRRTRATANMEIDLRDFGAKPGAPTFDSTTHINKAFAAAIREDASVIIPGEFYTSAELRWNDPYPRIVGLGMGKSVIHPAATTYNTLHVGSGAETLPGGGYMRDFSVVGPSFAPAKTNTAAILVDSVHGCGLERLSVENHDMGFDFRNNNYLAYAQTLYARFGHCNVGLNLRGFTGGVFGSGSDLPFYNCWLTGAAAGIHISGGGGGYHFYGGQVSCGQDVPAKAIAPLVMGVDYETGATGICDADFHGVNWEGWAKGYAVDLFETSNFAAYSCGFNGTQTGGNMAAGLWRHRNYNGSRLSFMNCRLAGQFSDAVLRNYASVSPLSGEAYLHESGWDFRGVFANGVQIFDPCVEKLASGGGLGHCFFRAGGFAVHMLGTMMLRYNPGNTTFEKSTNYGANWSAV